MKMRNEVLLADLFHIFVEEGVEGRLQQFQAGCARNIHRRVGVFPLREKGGQYRTPQIALWLLQILIHSP